MTDYTELLWIIHFSKVIYLRRVLSPSPSPRVLSRSQKLVLEKKQMQEFMAAHFALSMRDAKAIKYWKAQNILLSYAKRTSKYMMMKDNQQTTNPSHNSNGHL